MKVYDISKYMRYHNVLLEWYHSIIDKQTVYRNNCYDDNCIKTNDKVYFTKLILVQISTFIHFNDVSQAMMRNATDVKIYIYRFEFISRKYIFMLISHNLSITQLWLQQWIWRLGLFIRSWRTRVSWTTPSLSLLRTYV